MRYFFDTEFFDNGTTLQFISIGIVAEDGREFYAVAADTYIYDDGKNTATVEWLKANVLDRLEPTRAPRARRAPTDIIRIDLEAFIGDDTPEFWAYYSAHDWVVLTWLMGGMMSMPKGWPMLCHDLRVELDRAGLASVRDDGRADEHNALADARWVRDAYMKHLADTKANR